MAWLWLFSESLCWSPGTRLPLKGRASLEGFQISPPRDTNTTTRTSQGSGMFLVILRELSPHQSGVT